MSNLLSRQVLHFIRRRALIRPGEHVLVAVSGGADSVALLRVLSELSTRLKLRLTAAHLNHKIRGREADGDARFVRRLARELRVGFVGRGVDVPALARRSGVSLEMAGRKARYDFFAKAARARGCDAVATAHTADDNAETILLMLIRGCGLQGLAGIAPAVQAGKMKIVRPLLETGRKAIEQYLRSVHAGWREDSSNRDSAFLRNRVRHELLPLLEAKYNRGIRETLNRMGGVLREENDFIERFAEKAYAGAGLKHLRRGKDFNKVGPDCQSGRPNGRISAGQAVPPYQRKNRLSVDMPALNTQNFSPLHLALRRRVLRRWLMANGIDSATIDFQLINRLDELIARPGRSAGVSLTNGLMVRKNNQCLTIGRASAVCSAEANLVVAKAGSLHRHYSFGGAGGSRPTFQKSSNIKLNIPGTTILPGSGLRLKARIGPGVCRARGAFGKYPAKASLSLDKWRRRAIRMRPWRAGDRMRPYGMKGSKKIQDIFSDAKVPVELRHSLPVFECGREIIWIPGYRIASGWEVAGSAKLALQLCVW